jgi:hypothetical protein
MRTRPINPLLIGGNVMEAAGIDPDDDLGGRRSKRPATYPAPSSRMKKTRGSAEPIHSKYEVRCEQRSVDALQSEARKSVLHRPE